MDSTKSFMAQALPADGAAKLLRVFCFLRKHDRKTRIAKKTAELHAWRPQQTEEPPCEDEQHSPIDDKADLTDELNLLAICEEPDGPGFTNNRGTSNAAKASLLPRAQSPEAIRCEIKELQKGVITSNSDTSGVISATDLSSCMKSLNRVPAKGEVQWMIWEVDDDLDGGINWEEFRACYIRTLMDQHGLEPNQLYYLIQFLLCDTDSSQTVSLDEITAELQRIGGTEHLMAKIWSVLEGESEEQQLLRKLTLIVAQVVVMGAGIVSKAFVQAYQQAVHNARSGNAGAMAAKTVVRKNQMSKQQAREVLNFPTSGPELSTEEIQKQFTRYFEANDPAKGGSFYLQSKIFRAKEALETKDPEEEVSPSDKEKST
ncbi:hypothetical protein BBJ29_007624 [Phytophthora kernoviae]|uniref:EF-hand domain-containing protein n=1 Tax=Phytophthora kernoviae TaxID=325452 RepID=A0A3F2RFR6_9STRA|nr:hypothetical protein BBJ29_007624 [Phytophthora kernoviae]RLN55871.1 hypothetical protein BBP00_00008300 [Phytophthora kernoviae]